MLDDKTLIKSHVLSIRVDDELFEKLSTTADYMGMSLSRYIRAILDISQKENHDRK
jgi:antitoxin component of RelBE/YafQ-DinJ toxin-antitoxin module